MFNLIRIFLQYDDYIMKPDTSFFVAMVPVRKIGNNFFGETPSIFQTAKLIHMCDINFGIIPDTS